MSGTDITNWAFNEIEQHQEKDTKKIATMLGCPTNKSDIMMDCLRTKDWREIISIRPTHCGVS